jgi:hypothetical protein
MNNPKFLTFVLVVIVLAVILYNYIQKNKDSVPSTLTSIKSFDGMPVTQVPRGRGPLHFQEL